MTHATASLTTQDAIARGRRERAQAFAAFITLILPHHAARPDGEVTA
jgi:hypothetical protein